MDGTFGRGGHSGAILGRLGPTGRLLSIDRDPAAVASAPDAWLDDPRFELIRGEIAQLETIIEQRELKGRIDGILFDLGVSSPQLDAAERGFSFLRDGPLDMRMDPGSGQSAAEFIATVDEKTLKRVLATYGEERLAGPVARAIVTARERAPITRTSELAEVVTTALPRRRDKLHPATKTFQAIRIFVNRELEQLEAALRQSLHVLRRGGRLCVISFHSLEDRIVKRFVREQSREPEQYRGLPSVPAEWQPKLAPVGKPVTADVDEIARNPRARSARLRVAERR